MKPENTRSKDDLLSSLLEANHLYSKGMPIITDTEYDKIWKALFDIDPDCPALYHTGDDKTLVIGRKRHRHPIYGTQKAFDMDDLKPFLARFGNDPLVIEPKYDGCAAVFYKGKTRADDKLYLEGDGVSGTDITYHLPFIYYPNNFGSMESVEIIIRESKWDKSYGKNVRNTVAGWISREKIPYPNILELVSHNKNVLTKDYQYDGDIDKLYEILLECYNVYSFYYRCDGLMIKLKDESKRILTNHNGKFYHWSIAWKPPIETAETVCTDIEWNISRQGKLIPTVIYEPIELCDTVNQRVTGNNAGWISSKNILPGSILTIGKAGSIIPKILSVKNEKDVAIISEQKDFDYIAHSKLPTHCPVCQNVLSWRDKHLICNAPNCLVQTTKTIAYFYSDKGMDVKTIGEARIWELLENDNLWEIKTRLIAEPWQLLDPFEYNIIEILESIWGKKRLANYLQSLIDIDGKKTIVDFIAALGKPGLSKTTATKIFNYVKFGKPIKSVSQKAINEFINAYEIALIVESDLKNFQFAKINPPPDKTYCITGVLSQPREEMITYFESKGYGFLGQVTMNCDYLILGDNPGRVKQERAEKYGVRIVSEEEFMAELRKDN